jgi:hypothetical protein
MTTWLPTLTFRWLEWDWGEREDMPNSKGRVLQQAFDSVSEVMWRDVPTVRWEDRNLEPSGYEVITSSEAQPLPEPAGRR